MKPLSREMVLFLVASQMSGQEQTVRRAAFKINVCMLNHFFPPLTFIQTFRYTVDGIDVINKITLQIIQLASF